MGSSRMRRRPGGVGRVLFPLIVLGTLLLLVTLWRPDFWAVRGELPYDDADPTRGDWRAIPSQGHPDEPA